MKKMEIGSKNTALIAAIVIFLMMQAPLETGVQPEEQGCVHAKHNNNGQFAKKVFKQQTWMLLF